MTAVRFVDTTFRDGHACLWAEGMRTGMMLAVAEEMDRAGFVALEVIATSHFKKCVRELREDPWERIRLLATRVRATPLAAMGGSNPRTFGVAPLSVVRLYLEHLAAAGIRRVQLMEASNDMTNRVEPIIRIAHEAGLQVVMALVFSLSPRHTDAHYAQKARDAVSAGADIVYLKDSGGLLTPERVRTVVPAIQGGLGGTPLEFHTHCTTGLGPLSTLAALEAGVTTVHTAVPPLADGASQPSVFNVARNARALGFEPQVDERPLGRVRERLEAIARAEGLPVGRPLEYDHAQYVHQVPGGVISNLRHQLTQLRMAHRLPDVLAESVRVRADLGYPIMVTPFSQFVVSQAAINVFLGERYREVSDEVIRYALGHHGREAGAAVDPEVRDRITARPRALELARQKPEEASLEEVRRALGGSALSDEDLLLRYMAGSEQDIARMRSAGPPRPYPVPGAALLDLIRGLAARRDVRRVVVQRPDFSLALVRPAAPGRGAAELAPENGGDSPGGMPARVGGGPRRAAEGAGSGWTAEGSPS